MGGKEDFRMSKDHSLMEAYFTIGGISVKAVKDPNLPRAIYL